MQTANTTAANWEPCTEDTFWDMLGCLPPAYHKNGAFLVGEPTSHRHCKVTGEMRATYQGYRELTGANFEATSQAVTRAEFLQMLEPEPVAVTPPVPASMPFDPETMTMDDWEDNYRSICD